MIVVGLGQRETQPLHFQNDLVIEGDAVSSEVAPSVFTVHPCKIVMDTDNRIASFGAFPQEPAPVRGTLDDGNQKHT